MCVDITSKNKIRGQYQFHFCLYKNNEAENGKIVRTNNKDISFYFIDQYAWAILEIPKNLLKL